MRSPPQLAEEIGVVRAKEVNAPRKSTRQAPLSGSSFALMNRMVGVRVDVLRAWWKRRSYSRPRCISIRGQNYLCSPDDKFMQVGFEGSRSFQREIPLVDNTIEACECLKAWWDQGFIRGQHDF